MHLNEKLYHRSKRLSVILANMLNCFVCLCYKSYYTRKICGESILKPLELIFKSGLENSIFPQEWKKANVVPVHKRNNKQLIENYGPISLLPVCGKILERLIYNKMFEFFTENELISQNQSGFKPGDSCISQL